MLPDAELVALGVGKDGPHEFGDFVFSDDGRSQSS
jgi:hypothetical protein